MTISGYHVPKGSMVTALIGSANRDPKKLPDSSVFNLLNSPNKHIGFGKGIHHCLGVSLARMEAHVALQPLLDKLSLIDHEYRTLSAFRSLHRLGIKISE